MRRPWTARRHGIAGVALASALLLPATPAAAGTVTTLADSGAGSLRAAIDGAAPGETIDFAAGLEGTIELVSTLEIDTSLRIDGPGARRLAVSGMDAVRVFHVRGAGTEAEIRELTIRDGRVPGTYPMGAGLLADESASSVRLVRAAVLDNEAASTTDLPLGGGLGVVAGTLELVDSTVAGNRASGGGGGGVMIGEPAGFVIRASTIVGNSASAGGGVVSVGSAGTLTDSTIAGNTATTSGGGLLSSAFGSITVGRSLLSGNGCGGPIVSAGDNVSDAACFAAPLASDTVDAAAQVGALADHGGATDTVLPVPASPAVDHVGRAG